MHSCGRMRSQVAVPGRAGHDEYQDVYANGAGDHHHDHAVDCHDDDGGADEIHGHVDHVDGERGVHDDVCQTGFRRYHLTTSAINLDLKPDVGHLSVMSWLVH